MSDCNILAQDRVKLGGFVNILMNLVFHGVGGSEECLGIYW
jgi:hypothetical protein